MENSTNFELQKKSVTEIRSDRISQSGLSIPPGEHQVLCLDRCCQGIDSERIFILQSQKKTYMFS